MEVFFTLLVRFLISGGGGTVEEQAFTLASKAIAYREVKMEGRKVDIPLWFDRNISNSFKRFL